MNILVNDVYMKIVRHSSDISLDYTDSLLSLSLDKTDYGLPPFTLLLKPLMMLFDGKMGKNYRRLVDERRRQTKSTSPEDFRSIVLGALNDPRLIL